MGISRSPSRWLLANFANRDGIELWWRRVGGLRPPRRRGRARAIALVSVAFGPVLCAFVADRKKGKTTEKTPRWKKTGVGSRQRIRGIDAEDSAAADDAILCIVPREHDQRLE